MFLNPQGIEYSRALLEFAKGERMSNNVDSARWLAIHGANQYGEDKCSLDDRVEWVKNNEQYKLWRRVQGHKMKENVKVS